MIFFKFLILSHVIGEGRRPMAFTILPLQGFMNFHLILLIGNNNIFFFVPFILF